MKMGEKIQELRNARGMSQADLADLCGVGRGAVAKWETGAVDTIKRKTILKLAEIFDTHPAILECWESDGYAPFSDEIAEHNPMTIAAPPDADTYVIASDDSMMTSHIAKGDIVLLIKTDVVKNGNIVAVKIDDNILVRRYYRYDDANVIILMAESAYPPITITEDDADNIKLLGIAVAVQKTLQ